jgi:GGDEF domain-containing protein
VVGAGVVAKVLALAGIAALAPLSVAIFALNMEVARLLAVLASMVSAAAMIGIVLALRPILCVAAQLDARAGGSAGVPAASSAVHKHRLTGLPVREHFLAAVTRHIRAPQTQGVLGLVRLANFDQVLAFDADAAQRMISTVARRLAGAVKAGRLVAHVDRDCFALWFDAGADEAAGELEAVGYVLRQELTDGDLTFTPEIQLGSALYPVDAEDAGNLLNRAFVSLAHPQRTEEGAIAFFATSKIFGAPSVAANLRWTSSPSSTSRWDALWGPRPCCAGGRKRMQRSRPRRW